MPTKIKIILGIVALVSLAAGIFLSKYISTDKGTIPTSTPATPVKPASVLGSRRIDFTLTDTDDKVRKLSEWDGKVILLNFWATWCPPCRREIPAFIELTDKYKDKSFVIVGVALDTRQAAVDFVDPMGINYPILVGEQEGIALTQQYGNHLGVLPYTVIIDRHGIIRQTFRREVNAEEIEKLITPLM